jgi:hypothetical protein
MPYERQKLIRAELRARIPRGLNGSLQNWFRGVFCFFRMQGHPFEASVALG